MIATIIVIAALSAITFCLLKKLTLKTRLLTALSLFLLLSTGFIFFLSTVEDTPTEGSVTITKDVMEKEGKMTEAEWEQYKKKHAD